MGSIAIASGASRLFLTKKQTYFVRTDGSDSNSGTVDSAAGAFATWQHAYDNACATLDFGGQRVAIQQGSQAGVKTYTAGVSMGQPWTGGGNVYFLGDNVTPSNVVISATNANCFDTQIPIPGSVNIDGFKYVVTGNGNSVAMFAPGVVTIDTAEFGACATDEHISAQVPGSQIFLSTNYTISGGGFCHYYAQEGALVVTNVTGVTITGTPTFFAFAVSTLLGNVAAAGITFTGSATGQRFQVDSNSIISTGGAALTYFPGSTAGVLASGGIYI